MRPVHDRDCHRRGCCRPCTARTTMSLPAMRKYTAYGKRFRIARRVSARTARNCIGLSTMRAIVSSSAARNSAPRPGRRPSYQSRVSNASASASGRKLTRRFTRDPAACDGLHPMELRTRVAERAPSSADRAPHLARGSTRARPHVRPPRGFPREPSRARRVPPREVSRVQKVKETWATPLPV